MSALTLSKFFVWVAALFIVINTVSSVLGGGIDCIEDKSTCGDYFKEMAASFLANDKNIGGDVDLALENPEMVDYYRMSIALNIVTLVFILILLYKLGAFFAGINRENPVVKMTMIISVIGLYIVISYLFSLWLDINYLPFSGIIKLIQNIGVFI